MEMLVFVGLAVLVFGSSVTATTTTPTTRAPCSSGQYYNGSSCVRCGHCRSPAACSQANGLCSGGCEDGYDFTRDRTCQTVCTGNTWGHDCSQNCGKCADGAQCNRVSGACAVCAVGYQPDSAMKCLQSCTGNRWGQNCTQTCGNCAGGVQCDTETGACTRCAPGYKPDTALKCNQKCDSNKYGQDCRGTCGKCVTPQCNHVSGNCVGECLGGYWGSTCMSRCSLNCRDSQNCSQSTGNCPCQPGFQPGKCTSVCNPGTFGQDCVENCGYCLMKRFSTQSYFNCGHANGHCDACEDNREMPLCKDCKAGFWGPRCVQQCGQCGGEGRCHPTSGTCLASVCQDGWMTSTCDQKCSEGWYGQNCSKPCGRCRDNSACRHDNGICELDCEDGYEGVLCQEEQQSLVGPIVGGLLGAAFIIAVALIIVGFFRYQRKKQADGHRHDGFNTLADLHSMRRNDTSPRSPSQSQLYQNVPPSSDSHDNPTFNSDYDRVDRSHDPHAYDSHSFPATAANKTDPVYQNADATSSRRPVVALKPPNANKNKNGKTEKGVRGGEANNTYGNMEFGATQDGTYGNI